MKVSSKEPVIFCVICLGLLIAFQGLKNFIISATRSISWIGTTEILIGIGIIVCLLGGKTAKIRF